MHKYLIFLFLFPIKLLSQQLSLSECISISINNNLNVKKNQYYKRLHEIDKTISKKEFLPSINAGIYNNFTFGVDQDIFGNTKRNDNFNNNVSLNTQFILYNGGKIRNNYSKEVLDDESSFLLIESSKRDLTIDVINKYLQILLNKEILSIANISVQKADLIFQKTEKAEKLGFSSSKLLLEAKANLYKEKQRELEAKTNLKRSFLNLMELLQIEKQDNFDIRDDLNIPDIETPYKKTLDEIINTAINSSPKVKSLEAKLKSLKMQTEVTKSLLRPNVSLNTYIGTYYFNSLVSEREDKFFNQYKFNLYQQVRLGINIPIFNKGNSKLQIEKNKINEEIQINAINAEKQNIKSDITKIYFEMNSCYENYILAKEVENNLKKSLDLTEKSYIEGFSTFYEFRADFNSWIEAVNIKKKYKYGVVFNLILLNIYSDDIDSNRVDQIFHN